MHRFSTALAIVATLLLAQSCTNTNQTTAANVVNNHQEEHSIKEINDTHDSHSHNHSSHTAKSEFAKAKLTTPGTILPNTDIPITINIQDSKGKTIEKFDRFQEQFMHLILVSDDLQFFSHLHPTYTGNGRFEINVRFPKSGNYTFFSDYKPAGKAEQISILKTQILGENRLSSAPNFSPIKMFANTNVKLLLPTPAVKAGEEVTVMFHLEDPANNQPLKDLQPYLGEAGHLVILHQSPVLSEANYIHAHALQGTPPGKIHFITRFPKPGMYKLWGQFKRNGEIITADFWVNVI